MLIRNLMFVDLCTKVNNVLVSLIHAQGFLKFVLGDRDDILKTATIYLNTEMVVKRGFSDFGGGYTARFCCIFERPLEKFERR